MPSWELFEAQPPEYRESVLPRAVRARIAVEAASPFGWDRYVGAEGEVVAMRGFGASAPYEDLARNFRFEAEEIELRALRILG
jgi:transketolase